MDRLNIANANLTLTPPLFTSSTPRPVSFTTLSQPFHSLFALERFDPIGHLRQKDDLGQPLDTSAALSDGTTFDGLRKYLATRQSNFTRPFSRKLLGYTLARPVLPSDTALIDLMQTRLRENDTHFSAAVLTLTESTQFLTRRID